MRRNYQESCQLQYIQNSFLKDSKMQDSMKNQSKTNGRWTKVEHLKFLEGLRIHGKNWKKIEELVQTRTGSQIRSHAQKFFLKLQQSGKPQNSELSPNFNDFNEQAEAPTLNSKTVSEPKAKEYHHSYYLSSIIDHWKNSNTFDFWETLVDYRSISEKDMKKITTGRSFLHYVKPNTAQNINNTDERRSQN